MKKMAAALTLMGLLVAPVASFAQDSMPQAGEAQQNQGSNTQYKETTTYDFEGDDVTGNLVKPDGANIQGEQHGKTSSLIDIRSDFVPEMLETVEDM